MDRTILGAQNTHEAVVRLLMKHGADIEARNTKGLTALFQAAVNDSEPVVRLLVELGANIDAEDKDGETL